MDIVAQAPSKRTRKCPGCTTLLHRALSRVNGDLQLWLGLTGVSLVRRQLNSSTRLIACVYVRVFRDIPCKSWVESTVLAAPARQ
jgi:hypothetical protein